MTKAEIDKVKRDAALADARARFRSGRSPHWIADDTFRRHGLSAQMSPEAWKEEVEILGREIRGGKKERTNSPLDSNCP